MEGNIPRPFPLVLNVLVDSHEYLRRKAESSHQKGRGRESDSINGRGYRTRRRQSSEDEGVTVRCVGNVRACQAIE